MADAAEQSKRAEKRARQKANKAAAAAGEAPAAAAATPKPETNGGYPAGAKAKAAAAPPVAAAKAKAQAAPEPEPKAKAKAKAKGQAAEPKAEPKAAAQPKGKAAAAPAPKAKAAAAPAPEAPKAKATQPAAKAKQAAGKKVEKEEKEPERPKVERIEEMRPVVVDDGIGEWEVSAAVTKKKAKQQERQAQQAAEAAAAKAAAQAAKVPGMAPTGPAVNSIPGMEPTKAEKKAAAAAAKAAAAAPVAAPTAAAVAEEAPAAKPGSIVTVNVPENKIGRIIGPKGATLKMLQEKTGVTRIDTEGEKFTITGEPNAVAMAETAMREMIEKGYMSITFDNFSEDSLQVHPSAFPDLIGKQGAIIRKIKEELRAEVEIPPVPKNGHPAKKYKVTIAGSKDAVVKAKEVINSIMMYYHHELTHPGEVHEELEVVDWQLRFVIGKGGSEMRHIQKNFNVKVYVPREHSMNQMTVIVGERVNVDRAKAYIEKMLWNAEHAPKGRDRAEGVGDDQHEDEEHEPWMDQYMFKRRR